MFFSLAPVGGLLVQGVLLTGVGALFRRRAWLFGAFIVTFVLVAACATAAKLLLDYSEVPFLALQVGYVAAGFCLCYARDPVD